MSDENSKNSQGAHPSNSSAYTARWIGAIGLLGFAGFLWVTLKTGLELDPNTVTPVSIGKPAYDFKAKWIQGQAEWQDSDQEMTLSDFKNKPLVLNFWASWCVSCRSEALELEKFWRTQKKEVAVVGIAVQDTEDAALAFAEQFGKSYLLAIDESGQAGIDYGVTGVPETFFISSEGQIVHKHVGPVTLEALKRWLPKIR